MENEKNRTNGTFGDKIVCFSRKLETDTVKERMQKQKGLKPDMEDGI